MTPKERDLLQKIAEGKGHEGSQDVKNPAEGERMERLLYDYRRLADRGWIDLTVKRESMSGHDRIYRISATTTAEGRRTLAGR